MSYSEVKNAAQRNLKNAVQEGFGGWALGWCLQLMEKAEHHWKLSREQKHPAETRKTYYDRACSGLTEVCGLLHFWSRESSKVSPKLVAQETTPPNRGRPRERRERSRERFESWVSSPPYERSSKRFGDESAWPGNYRDISVDLAWQAWQAARGGNNADT